MPTRIEDTTHLAIGQASTILDLREDLVTAAVAAAQAEVMILVEISIDNLIDDHEAAQARDHLVTSQEIKADINQPNMKRLSSQRETIDVIFKVIEIRNTILLEINSNRLNGWTVFQQLRKVESNSRSTGIVQLQMTITFLSLAVNQLIGSIRIFLLIWMNLNSKRTVSLTLD